jgi:hypothetical protein
MAPTPATDILEFPDPTEPMGAERAYIKPLNGYRIERREAVGTVTVPSSTPMELEFPHHTPGQLAALVYYEFIEDLRRITVRTGHITDTDLEVAGNGEVTELILGPDQEVPEKDDRILSVEGLDLSPIRSLRRLDVNSSTFSSQHLRTADPSRLESLTLHGSDVSTEAVVRFQHLRILQLEKIQSAADDITRLLALRNLFSLGIRFVDFSDADLSELANRQSLEVLDLGYNRGVGTVLPHIGLAHQLRYLDLSGTETEDASMPHLSDLNRLEVLSLQRTAITDSGLLGLPPNAALAKLSIAGTATGDSALHHVVSSFPNLRSLDVRSTSITQEGISLVARLPHLRILKLSGSLLSGALAAKLEASTSISEFHIGPPHPDPMAEAEAIDIVGGALYVRRPR